ncbi:hypothetical protein MJH12_17430, partial [bacterium]|nr:hypothetical protein [bacterium]
MFFLERDNEEMISPVDLETVRLQLSQLDPDDGGYMVIQNSLKLGQFLQCAASDATTYIIEAKQGEDLFQYKKILHQNQVMVFVEKFF